ncbi:MAG TPA: hypothetical protein VIM56_00135 [Rhizomicrobium sp.]
MPPTIRVKAGIIRDATKKSKINLRAISEPKQRFRIKRPKSPNKNKGGAPKGNRNAQKHGLYTKEIREMRLTVRRMIAQLRLEAALVRADAAWMDAQTFARLRDAGLSPRVLWPSEN